MQSRVSEKEKRGKMHKEKYTSGLEIGARLLLIEDSHQQRWLYPTNISNRCTGSGRCGIRHGSSWRLKDISPIKHRAVTASRVDSNPSTPAGTDLHASQCM